MSFNKMSSYTIITCFREPSVKNIVILCVQHEYVRHSIVHTIVYIAQIHNIIHGRFEKYSMIKRMKFFDKTYFS